MIENSKKKAKDHNDAFALTKLLDIASNTHTRPKKEHMLGSSTGDIGELFYRFIALSISRSILRFLMS